MVSLSGRCADRNLLFFDLGVGRGGCDGVGDDEVTDSRVRGGYVVEPVVHLGSAATELVDELVENVGEAGS